MINKLTIEKIGKEEAVLKSENGQTVKLPKGMLPPDKNEGATVNLAIIGNSDGADEQKELAKAILNEIIGSGKEEEQG